MSDVPRKKSGDIVSGGLPVKITGIVFWGMVLVGLLIAFIMLESREQELASLNTTNTMIIVRDFDEHLQERHSSDSPVSP